MKFRKLMAVALVAAMAATMAVGCGGSSSDKSAEGSTDNSSADSGSDFDTKISAGMGSGDTPDVMYMWNYPAYADGLEPLDEYIDKEGDDYNQIRYSFDVSRVTPVVGEVRPVNRAVRYLIRAR